MTIKKTVEKILERLGYKYLRYAIPYRWICRKEKGNIDFLISILSDPLSVQTLKCALQYRKTRNCNYLASVYDPSVEREYKLPSGVSVILDPSQYFVKDIIQLSSNEVFIDGGGYIGDTTLQFIENTHGNFNKIHVFEPIQESFDEVVKNVSLSNVDNNKVIAHNAGLFSSAKEVYFDQGSSSARIDKHGKIPVKLVSLDAYLSERERSEITYIKLDIEGAELDALAGMRDTISKYKPKLAICIYHLPTDLWKIPLFIHQLNPAYKLYIRQHHPIHETVCYAI
jgi:FkbM family methyltransferase